MENETEMKKQDEKELRYHLYARGTNAKLFKWLKEEAKRQDRSLSKMIWQAIKAYKAAQETNKE